GFLPAEVTRFHRDGIRQSLLHDGELRADQGLLERHGHPDLTWKARIVEPVGVAQALMRDELEIFSTERVTLSVGEIAKRHAMGAADPGLELMHGAGEAIRRQPLGHGVGLDEGAVDFLRLRGQDSMESHGIRHDRISSYSVGSGLAGPASWPNGRPSFRHEGRPARNEDYTDWGVLVLFAGAQTVHGQAARYVVHRGIVGPTVAVPDGVEPECAPLARIHVVLTDEVSGGCEFHDLTRMRGIGVDGIAVGGQEVAVRREAQGEGSAQV